MVLARTIELVEASRIFNFASLVLEALAMFFSATDGILIEL